VRRKRQVITSGPRARDPYGDTAPRLGLRAPRVPRAAGAEARGGAAEQRPAPAGKPATVIRPGRNPARPSAADLELVDLSVDLAPRRPGKLVVRNPVLVASGTFGYGVDYGDVVDVERLGAICCKGTTLEPRTGNRPPRVTETPGGMLNSIGLQNPGVDAVIERYASVWASWKVPVLVNVAGESVEDYVAVVRRLDGVPGVAGIELNISCPNVGKGGLQFAVDRDAAAAVTAAVRRATDLPLLVKLSPNVTDIRPIAEAIERAGADALTAINTLSGMAIDRGTGKPWLGNVYGGLSGPAIKPVGLRIVYEVAQVVGIPIVGIGGIASLDDALDYLAVGASAVQVGTAIFADPEVPVRIIDDMRAYCAVRGLAGHLPLVGTALPARRGRPSAKGVEYRP
jgi:dihydroorotate dehydrogenase (NAD+) catalytic subunit